MVYPIGVVTLVATDLCARFLKLEVTDPDALPLIYWYDTHTQHRTRTWMCELKQFCVRDPTGGAQD